MKRISLSLLFILSFGITVLAHKGTLAGKIKDQKGGGVIQGASVVLKDFKNGHCH